MSVTPRRCDERLDDELWRTVHSGRDDVPDRWWSLMGELDVRNQTLGGCLIVRVAGGLDVATAPSLHEHILGQLALGKTKIVIDMSRVPFVDSTGLSALIVVHHEATARGGSVRLACAHRSVLRVIQITRLDRLFELYDDVCDALEAAMDPADPVTADRPETTPAAP
jgi:anti-anti-sigma factor